MVTHDRVDEQHSNIASVWDGLRDGEQAWPRDEQWAVLREADRLGQLTAPAAPRREDATTRQGVDVADGGGV